MPSVNQAQWVLLLTIVATTNRGIFGDSLGQHQNQSVAVNVSDEISNDTVNGDSFERPVLLAPSIAISNDGTSAENEAERGSQPSVIKLAKKKFYAPLMKHTGIVTKPDNSSNEIIAVMNDESAAVKKSSPPDFAESGKNVSVNSGRSAKSTKYFQKDLKNSTEATRPYTAIDTTFNFDNLEDIRKNFKKGDLSEEDEQLLRDVSHDSKFIQPKAAGKEYSKSSVGVIQDSQHQSLLSFMPITEPSMTFGGKITTLSPMDEYTVFIDKHEDEFQEKPPTEQESDSTKSDNNARSNGGSRHIYKIAKSPKSKVKNQDMLHKKDEQHRKYFENQVNAYDRKFLEENTTSNNDDINYSHTSITVLTAISPATTQTGPTGPTRFPLRSKDLPGVPQDSASHPPLLNSLTDASLEKTEGSSGPERFQIFINLFNHFYWQLSNIRSKISPPCATDLTQYLTGLDKNIDWALRAFDTSGHYRGQFLYGNDLWMGEKLFCEEINTTFNKTDQLHQVEFGFFLARVVLTMPFDGAPKIVQVGQCLPRVCTTKDVRTILDLDQHLQLLKGLEIYTPGRNMTREGNESNQPIKIISVRRTPGDYYVWKDRKFYIFCGVLLTITLLIGIATAIEFNEENGCSNGSEVMDSNCHGVESQSCTKAAKSSSKNSTKNERVKEKDFELFQIRSNDNNNIDIESPEENGSAGIKNGKSSEGIQDGSGNNGKAVHTISESIPAAQNALPVKKKGLADLPRKFLLCFGLNSNVSAILSVEKSNDELLSCIHGIRVLSLLWTIMVHTYLQLFTIGENRFRRKVSETSFGYQVIGNATFSVDSFFFISGLLVTLIFLKQQKIKADNTKTFIKKGFIHSVLVVIYRYIRLAPAYMFVIVFNQLALRHIFEHTVFHPTVVDHITCTKFWWRNILFINNWFPFQELCMIWSWYLANDMQFYIMAIILLIASLRYFKAAVITIIVFLTSSWITSGLFSLHFNYTHKVSNPFESFDFLYDKPWQRVGTYIMGMMTGYIIYTVKTPPRVSRPTNALLWFFSVGIIFLLVFGVWDGQLSVLGTAFYVSVGHTAWGLGLVWITLSCCWDHTNLVNRFLSYRGFLPLSRLTYCTYLIHPVIMVIISFQMQGPIHLEHPMILTVFLGNAVLSFLFAFVISLSFESPVIRILKICFRK